MAAQENPPQPVPPVQVVVAPPDSGQRLTRVEETQEEHARQLQDHDKVLGALVKHLSQLIDRLDRFEKRLLVAAVIVFSGTHNGGQLLDHLSNFVN